MMRFTIPSHWDQLIEYIWFFEEQVTLCNLAEQYIKKKLSVLNTLSGCSWFEAKLLS